jgi:hypothetical protein
MLSKATTACRLRLGKNKSTSEVFQGYTDQTSCKAGQTSSRQGSNTPDLKAGISCDQLYLYQKLPGLQAAICKTFLGIVVGGALKVRAMQRLRTNIRRLSTNPCHAEGDCNRETFLAAMISLFSSHQDHQGWRSRKNKLPSAMGSSRVA